MALRIYKLFYPADPCKIFDPINALHSGLGSFLPIFGGHRAFLRNLTSGWPWLTRAWPLTLAIHYALVMGPSHQIWWPQGIVKQLDPSWPLHDLWPQQCITLWSVILPTKFGGHRAFLSNLTPGWPLMTPAWPLTPAMHFTLARGSSHQIWWP